MMHAKDKKRLELQSLKESIDKYETITIADLTNLPSSTLQSLRKRLDKVEVKVTKKSLIEFAIKESKKKDLTKLQQSLEKSIPVLLLSNEDPFKLYKKIKENKSN